MGRKAITVRTLHGLSIEDLNALAKRANNRYTYTVTQAIIMRYQGIGTSVIATTLSKSYATIISYLNDWNNKGIPALIDTRGGKRPNTFTDEMLEGLRDAVENKSPQDFGFEQSKWDSNILVRYIEETYGKQYSNTWIRNILKGLNFSYKRGIYKPTLGDVELQESFKKNVGTLGYY